MNLQSTGKYNISFSNAEGDWLLSKASNPGMVAVLRSMIPCTDPEACLQQWSFDEDLSDTTISLMDEDYVGLRKHYIQVGSDNSIVITHDVGDASKWEIIEDASGYKIRLKDGSITGYLNGLGTMLDINANEMVWNIQPPAEKFIHDQSYFFINQESTEEGISLMLAVINNPEATVQLQLENASIQNALTYEGPQHISGNQMTGGQLVAMAHTPRLYFKGTTGSTSLLGQSTPTGPEDVYWTTEDNGLGYVRLLCTHAQGSIGWLEMNNDDPDNVHLTLVAEGDPDKKKQKWKFSRAGSQPY